MAVEQVLEVLEEVKPRLRGWLHLGVAPFALVGGVILVLLAPTPASKWGSAVFVGAGVLLFAVSATYHRGHWSPRVADLLRRFDHANIFLLIAATYTPYCLLLLRGEERVVLLCIAWVGAILGVAFRILWIHAPRLLHTSLYLALGWASVIFLPGFLEGARRLPSGVGATALILLGVGGLLYTLGSLVYGVQRPDPWPKSFGFHEVFHTITILAFVTQYVGLSVAVYSMR